MTLSELESVTKIAQQTAQVVAIVWGGAWAYLKFVRGRTFHYRAELAVDAKMVKLAEATALKVTVHVKNAGATKLPLTACDVVAAVQSGTVVRKWTEVPNSRIPIVLSQTVESDETVGGQELIDVPAPHPEGVALAYRARAELETGAKRFHRAQIRYADAIVTVEEHRDGVVRPQQVP
jgi:hypothetical protein